MAKYDFLQLCQLQAAWLQIKAVDVILKGNKRVFLDRWNEILCLIQVVSRDSVEPQGEWQYDIRL